MALPVTEHPPITDTRKADTHVVIEFLTFEVDPTERDTWMGVEESTWSRFLERQPGFVRKQLWRDVEDDHHVYAMIEWESSDHWSAISDDALAAVDQAMGPWFRAGRCQTFEILRDC